MRKLTLVVIVCVVALISCLKDSDKPNCSPVTIAAPTSEVDSLRTYLSENSIDAQEDSRGFFYQITTAGDTKPTVCSAVSVSYVGTFLNGTQFDASANASFYLSNLIIGWQEGIPLIGAGGSITLYLPPSLAYGASDYGTIPGGSYLKFVIQLVAVG